MTEEIALKLDMGARVRSFFVGHPFTSPLRQGFVARHAARLARAEELQGRALAARAERRAALGRRETAARRLNGCLSAVVAAAHDALERHGSTNLCLRLPRRTRSHTQYLAEVEVILSSAEQQVSAMFGLVGWAELVLELRTAFESYRDALRVKEQAEQAHVGAIAGLTAVTAEMLRGVRHLHLLVANESAGDAGIWAEWLSARQIHWAGHHHSSGRAARNAEHR